MFCGNLNDVHSSRMDLKSSYCHVFWSCRKQNSFFMYYFDVTHKKKSWMVRARNKSIMCLGRWCCCTFYGLLLCFTERRCQNLFYQWGLWLSVKKTTLDPGATHVKEKKMVMISWPIPSRVANTDRERKLLEGWGRSTVSDQGGE